MIKIKSISKGCHIFSCHLLLSAFCLYVDFYTHHSDQKKKKKMFCQIFLIYLWLMIIYINCNEHFNNVTMSIHLLKPYMFNLIFFTSSLTVKTKLISTKLPCFESSPLCVPFVKCMFPLQVLSITYSSSNCFANTLYQFEMDGIIDLNTK